MRYALAGDIGGTNMRAALVDVEGRLQERSSGPTPSDKGAEEVTEQFGDLMAEVIRGTDRRDLVGIGLAIAGPTDPETGRMYNPPNLPQFDGYSAKPRLEERFDLPASVANDATLAALGEQRFGAGRGYQDVIYITVSTGIGGGVILGGRLFQGAQGFAGEIGQMVIDPDGPPCPGGNNGCLEGLCSGTAVARLARERIATGVSSVLVEMSKGDPSSVDSRMVVEAARAGDPLSSRVIEEVAANLGIGLANLMFAFDPEVFVIGGGMSNALDLMLPRINEEIGRRYTIEGGRLASIVRSALGDDVGLIGAAAAAFTAAEETK